MGRSSYSFWSCTYFLAFPQGEISQRTDTLQSFEALPRSSLRRIRAPRSGCPFPERKRRRFEKTGEKFKGENRWRREVWRGRGASLNRPRKRDDARKFLGQSMITPHRVCRMGREVERRIYAAAAGAAEVRGFSLETSRRARL